jgi:thiol-disulfide isomerase/thioredoxin
VRNSAAAKPAGHGAKTRSLRAAVLLTTCALLFLSISCSQAKIAVQSPPAETKPPVIGPRVVQVDDAKIKQLLRPNGKPLLVNFWATWCGPCREEFPDLVRIDAEYQGKIDFITVSLDFAEELNTGVPQFLNEMKAEMPTYLLVSADENTLISSISKDWSGALPFTILYSEKGEITYFRQGKIEHQTLKSEIEKALRN